MQFASFNYPRKAFLLPRKPLAERLEDFKNNKSMRYDNWDGYFQQEPSINPSGKFFYLDSDFAPRLRWAYCDLVYSGIRHTGWFTDEFGDSEKIRGIVMQLPHERGWLAGWTMGEGMASFVECDVFGDKWTCARRADRMAELVAEAERERDLIRQTCPGCQADRIDDLMQPLGDYCEDCASLLDSKTA